MERTITITISEHGAMSLDSEGAMSPMELLGVLRFYEKQVWLQMNNHLNSKMKFTKKKSKS